MMIIMIMVTVVGDDARQDWLPDLNAHVEAQFDNKKQWYPGKVTQVSLSPLAAFPPNLSECAIRVYVCSAAVSSP
jgi:hypothetical protein